MNFKNIAIIGAAGAIGQAFTSAITNTYPSADVHLFSRSSIIPNLDNVLAHQLDYHSERDLEKAAQLASKHRPLDLVIVTIGMLHDEDIMPERALQELSADKFQKLFAVNTILPALIGKHFVPRLNKKSTSVFAALSARVGSISDNRLGGWYAYRASKAALNMTIKNIAIETTRRNKNAAVVAIHPGTVDSELSKPFQRAVKAGQLFTPEFSAQKMLEVINALDASQTGKCFAWDGQEITP